MKLRILLCAVSVVLGVHIACLTHGPHPAKGRVEQPLMTERLPLEVAAPAYDEYMVLGVIEGTVAVEVTVAPSGEVERAVVLSTIYPPINDVLEAFATRWLFQKSDDSSTHRIEFVYRFMPPDTLPTELGTLFIAPNRVEIRQLKPRRRTVG